MPFLYWLFRHIKPARASLDIKDIFDILHKILSRLAVITDLPTKMNAVPARSQRLQQNPVTIRCIEIRIIGNSGAFPCRIALLLQILHCMAVNLNGKVVHGINCRSDIRLQLRTTQAIRAIPHHNTDNRKEDIIPGRDSAPAHYFFRAEVARQKPDCPHLSLTTGIVGLISKRVTHIRCICHSLPPFNRKTGWRATIGQRCCDLPIVLRQ